MQSIDQAATALALKHYEIEPGITQIFRLQLPADSLPGHTVGLLEVNQDTVPGGIIPLYFAANADAGVVFPSTIVEITPDEFSKMQTNELQLPEGWVVRDLIPRPVNGARP